MPLDAYGVLVGAAVDKRIEAGDRTPHFQIQLRASGTDYRIAVNVRSAQDPPDLLYLADEAFAHPVWRVSSGSTTGSTRCPASPGGAGPRLHPREPLRPDPAPSAAVEPAGSRQRPVGSARPLRQPGAGRPAGPGVRVRAALGSGVGPGGQGVRIPARATGSTTST